MSEIVIEVCDNVDERFFAAIREARSRGRLIESDVHRNVRPKYERFKLVGYTSHGGYARIVVDDGAEEEPLFV